MYLEAKTDTHRGKYFILLGAYIPLCFAFEAWWIKEAQTAACFMDWKTELITEQEFQKEVGMMKAIQAREREPEQGR